MTIYSIVFALAFLALGLVRFIPASVSEEIPEARGVWLSREVVKSGTTSIYTAFQQLSEAGFNRVLVNTHYFGATIYPSDVIEAAGGIRQLPEYSGRDPLQECIDIGTEFNLEVVAWMEYGLMAHYSGGDTTDSGLILSANPTWEAVDLNGQHWQSNDFGNFHWMDAGHPQVASFITEVYRELVQKHPGLGGVETDRIRYPSQDFSYNPVTVQRYMEETGNFNPITINYTHPQWNDWLDWREQQTTALAGKIYRAVKSVNPAVLVTAAVAPPYMLHQRLKLQAWDVWADSGYVDVLEPMLYVNDNSIANQVQEAIAFVPKGFSLYPGIAHQGDESLVYQIETTRNQGVGGMTIWYYDNLTPATYDKLKSSVFAIPAAQPHNDLISDNSDLARFSSNGSWQSIASGYLGNSVVAPAGSGEAVATWQTKILKTSPYHIFAHWIATDERASNAVYRIDDGAEIRSFAVNQKASGSRWVHLLTDTLHYQTNLKITLDNQADGPVNADAVRIVIPAIFDITDIHAADSVTLQIQFNRPLDRAIAQDITHYLVSPALQVNKAELDAFDNTIIQLTTTPFQIGLDYTLSVTGLYDIYGNAVSAVETGFIFEPGLTYFEIDNNDPTFTKFGSWTSSTDLPGFFGTNYFKSPTGNGENRAQWWAFVGQDGHYEVSVWLPQSETLSPNAIYTVLHGFGTDTLRISQRNAGAAWQTLGVFPYKKDNACSVLLSNKNAGGDVVADAIRIRRVIVSSLPEESDVSRHPENFRLNQNYPNPFNPETTIPFELVSAGHVRLDIYDTSGQHITSLVDNYLSPGFYTAHFNADHLASGIYYYRLQNHINFQTRRMILIK